MPFPVMAALAGVQAIAPLLKKRYEPTFDQPNFFVKNPQELEALIRQKTQAQYGTAQTDIREQLANSGLLSSGAYPETLIRSGISQSQDIASQILDLYSGEFKRSRDFQANKFFGDIETQKFQDTLNEQHRKNTLDLLLGLGGAGGNILFKYLQNKKKKKKKVTGMSTLDELFGPSDNVDFNPAPDPLDELLGVG